MDSRPTESSSQIPWIITAVVSVAALYYGRDVIVPIVVAMLLTILLAPLASRLERHRLGRTLSAFAVWIAAFILIVFVGWLVVNQGIRMATQIPAYSATISKKIQSIRGAKNSGIGKAAQSIQELANQISNALQSAPSDQNSKTRQLRATGSNSQRTQPVPVEVVGQRQGLSLSSIRTTLAPLLVPILKILIVFVVTAFMLLRRRDIQERLFTLAGLSRIRVTKQVFTDATNRMVRYLWMLSSVNFSFGALFGTALYFLGVPNALLWGVLTALLRFIPYIGSTLAAAMPILLSFAIFGGWTKPLIALGVFLFLEGIIGYAVEPLLYARRTGVSPLAILVAAIFWAAVWGPIGLLLSTPLTVCIVAIGHYMPELEFLSILLGDRTGVATDVQLYQSLSRGRLEESRQLVDAYIKEKSLHDLYDSIFMPVLVLAEKDRSTDWHQAQRRLRLFQGLRTIVEELTIRYPRGAANSAHVAEIGPDDQILPYRHPESPRGITSCLPVRDEGDEVACLMLAHLLKIAGYNAHDIALGTHREMLDEVAEHDPRSVYISALPPFAISSIRRLYKRLRSRFSSCRIGICLWSFTGDTDSMKNLLNLAGTDALVTTLGQASLQIQQLQEAPQAPAQRAANR